MVVTVIINCHIEKFVSGDKYTKFVNKIHLQNLFCNINIYSKYLYVARVDHTVASL